MQALAKGWDADRLVLETTLQETTASRDAAVTDRDEALRSRDEAVISRDEAIKNRDEATVGRDEAVSELKSVRLLKDEQVKILDSKIELLESRVEELDRLERMLLDLGIGDKDPRGDVSVVQLVQALVTDHKRAVEEREEERKRLDELTKQELASKRDALNEVMERTDLFEEKRPGMKRKEVEIQQGAATESQQKRQKREAEWPIKVDHLIDFLRHNIPVPDHDGSISELRAINLVVGTAVDGSMRILWNEWLDQATAEQWYCLDEVVLGGISHDAEISEDEGCSRHHQGGKWEKCYQIPKDELHDSTIICRMRRGPGKIF
ncbi:hypothetical protein F5Y01DRAFT_322369 [Xylaria sp. FL0043]|nr:hypothetical protein F5Y01DRAFT_322369 [Xylaria sp. FL0043]